MSLSRNDRYASVEQFREALWQVMHANDMGAQTPDFSFLVAAEEHTKRETGPDSSMLESDSPALIAYALLQEEVTFAGVNSGPLLASHFPEQENLSVEVSSQARPGVVRRKKHRCACPMVERMAHIGDESAKRGRFFWLVLFF